jgi:peptidoglycan/LPS O-acetylase OafA/YrhL
MTGASQAAEQDGSGLRTAEKHQTRLPGLDGVRGIAALFVVLHHCWLLSFSRSLGAVPPAWTSFLALGHLAVVVFIVLSGFSLAIGPARSGWRLGSVRRFLKRRAWRILPPYWAALAFSLVVAWTAVPQPGAGEPTGKTVVVYGLLLQDVFGSPSPNGAFWSIAIEAQLYLILPLMLLIRRRVGAAAVVALMLVPAVGIQVLALRVPVAAMFERFVPQMAVLFAIGVVAAHAVPRADRPHRSRRLGWLALAAAVPPIALIALLGVSWTLDHLFWVDLLCGPAIAFLIVSLASGGSGPLARVLDSRPLRTLGSFSYSLYLVHAPIVVAMCYLVVAPVVGLGVHTLIVMLTVVAPIAVGAAWLFASVFELPFQRHRSWSALALAVRGRLRPASRAAAPPSTTPSEPPVCSDGRTPSDHRLGG